MRGVKVDRVHLETVSVSKQPPSCFGYRFFLPLLIKEALSALRLVCGHERGDFPTFFLFPVDVSNLPSAAEAAAFDAGFLNQFPETM